MTDGLAHAGSHDWLECSFEDEGEVAIRFMEDESVEERDKPKRYKAVTDERGPRVKRLKATLVKTAGVLHLAISMQNLYLNSRPAFHFHIRAKSSTFPNYLMLMGFTVTQMNEWMDGC